MVREVLATNALNAGSTSSRPHPAPYHKISYDWITKAALYPYNKEMHALVRFRDLLKFKITGIADPPGKGMVGRDAGEAIGTTSSGIRIRPCLQDALRDADTLILGYVDQLGRLSKRDLLREAIQTALEANVNIFSFHAVPYERYADLYETARRKELHIAYPHLPAEEIGRTLNTRPTSPVDIPVLGVFGTSSQQGKFTLQLLLRRKLMQVGYRVGGIGTEHHAELFGLDLAFPIGYASPLTLPLQYYAPYLDQKLRDICKQTRPDILLVGAQSGTVPYHVHEHATHALPSLAFALGTKPDACILVVNSIDSHSYIRDTIDGLRAIAKVPTLLLAMGDQEKHIRTAYGRTLISPRKMSPEEIGQHLQRLEDTFAIPAVEILSDEGQNKMIETIIEHFRADPLEQTLEVICKTELPLSRQ
ncbi:MAG: DUF1611 domain-containing protein [bacterium]|nr:DUF1611 domain-containing protein [bacterium]